MKLETGGERATVRGALQADRLDINPYIERPSSPRAPPRPRNNEEWSDKPITLGLLKKVDADVTLDTGKLTARKLAIDKAHIAVSLADGRLKARLDPMTLYGGKGSAGLEVDASGAVPAYHNTLRFEHVALAPFLTDSIGVRQIEGTGVIALDVSSHGDTARAIMGGLTGKGSIDFRDGRLRGVNLGQVARSIQHLLGTSVNADSFTDYTDMGASFTLANGVLDSNNFHMAGPVLHASGAGSVDIGNRTIDFRIVPATTASVAHEKIRHRRAVPYLGALASFALQGGCGESGERRHPEPRSRPCAVQGHVRQTGGQKIGIAGREEEAQKILAKR